MKNLTNKSILVIDDDPGMLRALTKVLSGAGAKVTSANWAGDGIEILTRREKRIDLVITDLRMPLVSGMTVVYAIHQVFPALPVVVLTAFATPEIRSACFAEGAAAFLEKPSDSEELLRTAREALGLDIPTQGSASSHSKCASGSGISLKSRRQAGASRRQAAQGKAMKYLPHGKKNRSTNENDTNSNPSTGD